MPPAYPGYGQKCNGCGLCCIDQPCPVADNLRVWKDGKCKALQLVDGVYRCGMMTTPDKFTKYVPKNKRAEAAANIRRQLGSGVYCDARRADHLGRTIL